MGMRRRTPLMRSRVPAGGAEVMTVRHLAGHQARAELAQVAKMADSNRQRNESCEMNGRRSQEGADAGTTRAPERRAEAAGLPAASPGLASGGHGEGDRLHSADGR